MSAGWTTSRPSQLLALVAVLWVAGYGAPPVEPQSANPAQVPTPTVDVEALDRRLDALVTPGRGDGLALSVWVGGPTGEAWFAREASTIRASASAIKTAYLIELFAAYADALDAPASGADAIVNDDAHLAIAHFTVDDLADIRAEIADATIRRIGQMMIRGTDVSNAVYNAAANVTTALLGGPEALTGLIHDRDPAFGGLVVRRYMLAARDVTGDNEATAAALAAVLQRVAARDLPGLSSDTVTALWEILRVPEDDGPLGMHYFKSGSLGSDPMTRIRSGFWDGPEGVIVYVVMAEQPTPGTRSRDEVAARLVEVSRAATDAMLEAAGRVSASRR